MNISNDMLRRKAYGIMKSIENMNESEKQDLPSESFGRNYNNLRNFVLMNNKELVTILPPPTDFINHNNEDSSNIKTTNSYSEIHTFCSEIYQLLGKE